MTFILRVPLVACALAAVAVVSVDTLVAGGGPILAAAIVLAGGLLALLAADVPRRLLWGSLAATALVQGTRVLLGPPPSVDERVVLVLAEVRAALAAPLQALVPEPEAGILLGIVLGERASIGPELRAAFADSGTTHLLAISGFNMTLVAAAVALVLRGQVGPVACACVTVGAVGLYSLLVGLTGSVARAALMAAVAALALAMGRPSASWNALGASVLAMLLLEPGALLDLGLLLSAAATAGLIAWQSALSSRFTGLPGPVREGLAATLAATAPTLPIIAAAFGRVSLVSPLANLLAVPLFAPAILLGIATSAIGALWIEAARPVALAAFAVTSALRWVVEATASLPLAAIDVPPGPLTGAVLAGMMVALVVGIRRVSARVALPILRSPLSIAALEMAPLAAVVAAAARIPARAVVAVALCVSVTAGGAIATASLGRPDALRVRALDVGQGDAFLIESRGRYALIDGGPDPVRLLRELRGALPPWVRRIDLVVLTHEHADHGNGLLAVLDRYEVGLAVEPAGMSDVPLVRSWAERTRRAGVRRVALQAGARVRLGPVTVHVLAPGRDRRPAYTNLVLLVEAPEGSVLFMGDATDDVIADLLLAPNDLAARLYVPPHHGADTAHAAALLEAVRPEAALLSVGASNRYGHPTPGTLAALSSVPVYRTDRHGTVEVELDGDRIHVRTDKAGVPAGGGGPVPRASPAR